jgi:stage V sporulation protein B
MSEVTRRAARGAAFHLAAQLVVMGCGYLVAVVLARSLGPAVYGVYGIVYSFLLTVELVGRLGIPQAVSKLVAERDGPSPDLEATGVTLALLVYLILFVGLWLGAPWLGLLFHVPDGARLFRIAALDVPFYGLYFMAVHILNGRRAFGVESMAIAFYGLAKAAGILVLLRLGPTVEGALVVNVLGSIATLGFVVLAVGRGPFALTMAAAGPILRLAGAVALIGVGSQLLLALDLWGLNALGAAVAETEKGFYVAASNIARLPILMSSVMTAVLVPSIARALAAQDRALAERTLKGGARFLAVTLLPACGAIAVNAPETMALLFSDDYAAAGRLLALLIFAQGLGYTLFVTFANVLMAGGRARTAAGLALAAVPLTLLLNALLIPRLGATGAALASLLSLGTAATIAALLVQRLIGPLLDLAIVLKTLVVTGVVCLVGLWIDAHGLALLAELVLLGILTLVLLPLLGLVTRADLAPLLPARTAHS